jgi:2-oxoglutarate ferredoxin oxidoreductase subunit alpha
MVRTRAAKIAGITVPDVQVDDPSGSARTLVLGWGSTYGPIQAAARLVRAGGEQVATAHLRHLNPFPANLEAVLKSYDRVIVPEMNLGQLAMLLRSKYLVDIKSHTAVRGLPFTAAELATVITDHLEEVNL